MTAQTSIAVIDDDASVLSALVALIRSSGYDVREFSSADEFLRSDTLERFACIVTDIQMPGTNGIELKRQLAERHNHAPVIMTTARDDPGIEQRALASGAASFMRKPFDAKALIARLEDALKG